MDELEYRLYYDPATGAPRFYTMDTTEEGTYIKINIDQYAMAQYNILVIDGKIVVPRINDVFKLKPSTVGTPCDPDDVSIPVTIDEPHLLWAKAN